MGRGPPNAAPRATSRSPRSDPTASPPPGTRPVRPDSSPYSLRSGPTMNSTVIEVEGLRKEYRRVRGGRTLAVDGLDMHVPEGGVFGFVGPNGSGKTTTIRCLLGLVRPTGGRAAVLGAPIPEGLPRAIARIGAIVEAPALFLTMSGRENLRLLAAVDGIGIRQVDHTLERVGLADRS